MLILVVTLKEIKIKKGEKMAKEMQIAIGEVNDI